MHWPRGNLQTGEKTDARARTAGGYHTPRRAGNGILATAAALPRREGLGGSYPAGRVCGGYTPRPPATPRAHAHARRTRRRHSGGAHWRAARPPAGLPPYRLPRARAMGGVCTRDSRTAGDDDRAPHERSSAEHARRVAERDAHIAELKSQLAAALQREAALHTKMEEFARRVEAALDARSDRRAAL